MADVIQRRGFESGVRGAPPAVRRALMPLLTRMTATDPPIPLPGDLRVTLWIPTAVTLFEANVPNTGWSLLYDIVGGAYVLVFLCETPAR